MFVQLSTNLDFSLIVILSLVVSFIICQKRFVLRTEHYFDHYHLEPCYKLLLLSSTTVIKDFIRRFIKFQVSLWSLKFKLLSNCKHKHLRFVLSQNSIKQK